MKCYVTDTHSLLWHLSADARLSIDAQTIFQQVDTGAAKIYVPSIVLVEAVYL
jgi:predicted nucleic-acid-binding protein